MTRPTEHRASVGRLDPLAILAACTVLTALITSACSRAPAPVLIPLKELSARTPVVFVPGITGTKLRHRETGKQVWGGGKQLLLPRDGGYGMARPIHFSPSSEESLLEATATIDRMRLAVISQDVYGGLAELLERNGYRIGDLAAPEAGDSAFFFPYDWRLDNVIAARKLGERLEQLRRARGEELLRVDLICQSNGANICRYLLKYGGAPLGEAEAGQATPPANVVVNKLILLGSASGGSLRMLRELHRGRTYLTLVGRKIRPEVLFSCPSVYQELPVVRQDLFLDGAGKSLGIDLFDAETWRRYGLSVFDPRTKKRLARRGRDDLFGDEEQRLAFLRRALDNARRFHRLLDRDVKSFGDTRYYSLQSNSEDTPDRAVLLGADGAWEMLFTGDGKLERQRRLHAMATARGDEHGTVASQMWLSPQEKAAFAAETFYVDELHFEMILHRDTHRRLLDFLYDGNSAP